MRALLCLLLLSMIYPSASTVKRKQSGRFSDRPRRAPSSFALAYLQRSAEEGEEESSLAIPREQIRIPVGSRRRDFVVNDAKCLSRCNKELTIGMDMVDAHTAFGSIDVPSVMSSNDLDLFCSLDAAHSQCIDDCGYSVQFNLREYICRRKKQELVEFIPCYRATAPFLTRYCTPRCGSYRTLEHSASGYSMRCRQLLCDHACAEYLLRRVCGTEEGKRASEFLLHFSRIQVDFWITDYARVQKTSLAKIYPEQCLRLHCDGFDAHKCPRVHRRKKRLYYYDRTAH